MRTTTTERMEMHAQVGQRIRERREALGMSLRDLADAMPERLGSVSYGTLGKIEEGTSASLWVVVALCDVFDCTIDDLVPV